MKVLKFGGTSVGTVESLRNVKKIVESISGNVVIVVSALGGLTDVLINTAKKASLNDESWREDMQGIRDRHFNIVKHIVPENLSNDVESKLNSLLDELERNYEGVYLIGALPQKVLDVIVSFGERMSSLIVAAMVKDGKRYYAPDFIKTEKWYDKNIVNSKLTNKLIKETFENIGNNEKAIVTGFISSDSTTQDITNLGRGGSDYTGALIAAVLEADTLEIWTDVDGFMTADPRIVKDAIIIDHLSFTESMELCTFGAKVIYPPTIYPVFHKNIPIKILNTFNPGANGTLITDQVLETDLEIKGVSALKGVSLITIEINSNKEECEELSKRAFKILSKQAVKIIPVANPDPTVELNFAVTSSDAGLVLESLRNELEPEIKSGKIRLPRLKDNRAAIALVGKDMRNRSRLAARIGHSLRRIGINVDAYSTGNSDTTLIYLIDQEKSSSALPLIHSLVY